ncbi:MAG: hypothetical protein ACLTYN_10410 [Dysosmobacter welbionis]
MLFGWRHHQRCAAASGNSGGELLWWLLSLPVMVLELCAAYQEFYAHAEVLEELDPELAGSGGCFGNGGSACCWGCLDVSSWH